MPVINLSQPSKHCASSTWLKVRNSGLDTRHKALGFRRLAGCAARDLISEALCYQGSTAKEQRASLDAFLE